MPRRPPTQTPRRAPIQGQRDGQENGPRLRPPEFPGYGTPPVGDWHRHRCISQLTDKPIPTSGSAAPDFSPHPAPAPRWGRDQTIRASRLAGFRDTPVGCQIGLEAASPKFPPELGAQVSGSSRKAGPSWHKSHPMFGAVTRLKTPTCRPSWTKGERSSTRACFDAGTTGYTVLRCRLEGFGIR